MDIDGIIPLHTAPTNVDHYEIAAEKRVSGDPRQSVANGYSDPCGEFHVGIWQGEPAVWRVAYSEHEYCEILEGRIRMTDDSGASMEVGPGDRFVIAAGFRGTWEVLERARKVYVIFEKNPR